MFIGKGVAIHLRDNQVLRFGKNGVQRCRRGRRCRTGGRCRGTRLFVGYVVVVIRYSIVSVVFFGFVVVDDGVIGNIGYGFVLLVDSGVLGVDVSKVGAVVGVDVTVPCVVVDGNLIIVVDGCITKRLITYRNTIYRILERTTAIPPISLDVNKQIYFCSLFKCFTR